MHNTLYVNRTSLFSQPIFTSEEVHGKIFDLQDKVASVNRIPKPKPKVEKPVKNETESMGENSNSTDSSSEETSQNGQTAGASENLTDETEATGSEAHDEL